MTFSSFFFLFLSFFGISKEKYCKLLMRIIFWACRADERMKANEYRSKKRFFTKCRLLVRGMFSFLLFLKICFSIVLAFFGGPFSGLFAAPSSKLDQPFFLRQEKLLVGSASASFVPFKRDSPLAFGLPYFNRNSESVCFSSQSVQRADRTVFNGSFRAFFRGGHLHSLPCPVLG